MITVYGIRNCDKIKRALAWFEGNAVTVRFHDYRKDGVDAAMLRSWLKVLDWNALINRSGTTWRGLPDEAKAAVTSAATAVNLLVAHPAIIKRPLVISGEAVHVGYDESVFRKLADREHAV